MILSVLIAVIVQNVNSKEYAYKQTECSYAVMPFVLTTTTPTEHESPQICPVLLQNAKMQDWALLGIEVALHMMHRECLDIGACLDTYPNVNVKSTIE
jgi:hypothetical protein